MTRGGWGFHAVVGNPPFAGKNNLINGNRPGYLAWLKTVHDHSHGNADLVAHFYRRAFSLVRPQGAFGLIATNTIAQGDTRSTGLRWICKHGGEIFAARRRLNWPGQAAVIVSVVYVRRGSFRGARLLDDREVPTITAFLFHRGGHDDPAVLVANEGLSFIGSYVLGMGFTFDDSKEDASPVAEMHRLIAKDRRNAEKIFPYLGGEEVNSSPTHSHHRYVINFGEMSEEEARAGWPELMEILELKARGRRGSHSTGPWWQLERLRPELYRAIGGLERVLIISRVSNTFAFAFVTTHQVLNEKIVVVATDKLRAFAFLQCRVHETWGRFFNASLKDDMQYAPSDSFETYPFPPRWQTDPGLEATGEAYYDFRAALMVRNNEGLTATYNRFHDPNETDSGILKLRDLHALMDRAVLDAYGWADIELTCEFLLDYEEDEDDESSGTRRKKKPWRYRWPDEIRDEVLARLLELNAQRAKEPAAPVATRSKTSAKRRGAKKAIVDGPPSPQLALIKGEDE
jgi:hypothetical protein